MLSYQHPKICNGKHGFSFSFSIIDPRYYPIDDNNTNNTNDNSSNTNNNQFNINNNNQLESSGIFDVQCFSDDIRSFPPIRRVGDIIRLHRCTIQTYQNHPQLLWFERKSSYVLFSHPINDELIELPPVIDILPQNFEDNSENGFELFSSSPHYRIDPTVERDYIHYLMYWKVCYFMTNGFTDSLIHSNSSTSTLSNSLSTINTNGNYISDNTNNTTISNGVETIKYHFPLRKINEFITNQSTSSTSTTTSSTGSSLNDTIPPHFIDFIGMFIGLFPIIQSSSPNTNSTSDFNNLTTTTARTTTMASTTTTNRHSNNNNINNTNTTSTSTSTLSLSSSTYQYFYVWDGSYEGGIYPSGQELAKQLETSQYLMISTLIYNRIELSIKIILKYKEVFEQLHNQSSSRNFHSNNNNNDNNNHHNNQQSIKSILTILHQSLSKLKNECDKIQQNNIVQSNSNLEKNSNRYLPGGYGIFSIPSNCINQLQIVNKLQPGTWIRARKMLLGSYEEIHDTKKNEIVSARLTNASSINILPPYQL